MWVRIEVMVTSSGGAKKVTEVLTREATVK